MTFLELQNAIVQTRKARKGVKNRTDYFKTDDDEVEETEEEKFYKMVYRKALKAANSVVQHYVEAGEISSADKINVIFNEKQPKPKPKPTYDPQKEYLVSRQKAGRPKHTITPAEAQKIRELRYSGWSINAISKELGINNRLIMAFCRENML